MEALKSVTVTEDGAPLDGVFTDHIDKIGKQSFLNCYCLNVISIKQKMLDGTYDSDIRLEYVIDLDTLSPDDVSIELTWPKGSKTVNLSELTKQTSGEYAGCYIVGCNLAAKEMNDEIATVIKSGSVSFAPSTYKLRTYLEEIAFNYDELYSDEAVGAAKSLLYYGAAAQTLFGYNCEKEEDLANYDLENTVGYFGSASYTPTSSIKSVREAAAERDPSASYTSTMLEGTGLVYAGSALKLKSLTQYVVCFKKEAGATDVPAITMDGNTVETYGYTEDGVRYTCCDITKDFELNIGGKSVTFNASTYFSKVLQDQNSENDSLRKAVSALYYASEEAKLFNSANN